MTPNPQPYPRDRYGRTPADAARLIFSDCCGELHKALTDTAAGQQQWVPAEAMPVPASAPPVADAAGGAARFRTADLQTNEQGWREYPDGVDPPLLGDPDRCDIASVDIADMSPAIFFRDFYVQRRPLIIRGAAKHWEIRKEWTRQLFMDYDYMLGGAPVHVGTIPYPESCKHDLRPHRSHRSHRAHRHGGHACTRIPRPLVDGVSHSTHHW